MKEQRNKRIRESTRSFESMIKAIDVSDLRSDYEKWPELARATWDETNPPLLPRNARSIVFAGMGGSGISGDLLCDISREQRVPLHLQTVKDYHLPKAIDQSTIVVAISCSGNTEETLNCVVEARERGIDCYGFGSGGLMEQLARGRLNFPFTKTGMLKVPRSSFPALFFAVLKFLSVNSFLKVEQYEISDCVNAMEDLRKARDSAQKTSALWLASEFQKSSSHGGSIVVYASSRTRAVGLRFRQSLNENAKLHAFNGEVPELCHNDIVGWDGENTTRSKVLRKHTSSRRGERHRGIALLLELPDDSPETRARFEVVEETVKLNGGVVLKAPFDGESYLARVLSMLYTLDYTSYYLAVLRGIDPAATPSIDFLKKRMSEKLDLLNRLRGQNS
jgi:glucose/mannose-6-phosphate isomerase